MMRVHEIPVGNVSDFWPLVSPMLERAVRHNPHMDMADCLQVLMAGFAQLIVGIEDGEICVAAVMERTRYPKHVVANILFLAGRRGTMGARLDVVTEHLFRWARAHGCDRIALIGLPGLTKVVKRHGGQSLRLIHAWRDV